METYRIIEIKKNITENNDKRAQVVREKLKDSNTFVINVMSSPGSGKTTTLLQTINALKDKYKLGVIEADLDSDVDASTISKTGIKVVQLNTGHGCHMTAAMADEGLEDINYKDLDLVFLENIGNLICPTSFDTGATSNICILSVPEGDDKPLKYPPMFEMCEVMIINKIDAASFFDFDIDKCISHVKKLNPEIKVFPLSAKTGEGIQEWIQWVESKLVK